MHTNGPKEDPLVDMGYEIRDVDYPKLRKTMYYFFGFSVICFVVGYFVYINREGLFLRGNRSPVTNASLTRRLPEPPNPLLQNNVTAKTDLVLMRRQEDARLNGTGYTDDTRTRAYIPIEKAMDLIVERGVPKTNGTAAAGTPGPNTGAAHTTGATGTTTPASANTAPPTGAAIPMERAPTTSATATPANGKPDVKPNSPATTGAAPATGAPTAPMVGKSGGHGG